MYPFQFDSRTKTRGNYRAKTWARINPLESPLLVYDRVEDAVDADYVLVAKAPGVSGQQCSVSVWLTQVSVLVVRIFPVLVF